MNPAPTCPAEGYAARRLVPLITPNRKSYESDDTQIPVLGEPECNLRRGWVPLTGAPAGLAVVLVRNAEGR